MRCGEVVGKFGHRRTRSARHSRSPDGRSATSPAASVGFTTLFTTEISAEFGPVLTPKTRSRGIVGSGLVSAMFASGEPTVQRVGQQPIDSGVELTVTPGVPARRRLAAIRLCKPVNSSDIERPGRRQGHTGARTSRDRCPRLVDPQSRGDAVGHLDRARRTPRWPHVTGADLERIRVVPRRRAQGLGAGS